MRIISESPLPLNSEQLAAARAWVADCVWMEDADELAELTDREVCRGIDRHYAGGIAQFIADCGGAS